MNTIVNNGFFSDSEIKLINSSVMAVNNRFSPAAPSGEFLISYRFEEKDTFTCAYHAALDDRSSSDIEINCAAIIFEAAIDLCPYSDFPQYKPIKLMIAFFGQAQKKEKTLLSTIYKALSRSRRFSLPQRQRQQQ